MTFHVGDYVVLSQFPKTPGRIERMAEYQIEDHPSFIVRLMDGRQFVAHTDVMFTCPPELVERYDQYKRERDRIERERQRRIDLVQSQREAASVERAAALEAKEKARAARERAAKQDRDERYQAEQRRIHAREYGMASLRGGGTNDNGTDAAR